MGSNEGFTVGLPLGGAEGDAVGLSVWPSMGLLVGPRGMALGPGEGSELGLVEGRAEGEALGFPVGVTVGFFVGTDEGGPLGIPDGTPEGLYVLATGGALGELDGVVVKSGTSEGVPTGPLPQPQGKSTL